jgi:hypothetical protein
VVYFFAITLADSSIFDGKSTGTVALGSVTNLFRFAMVLSVLFGIISARHGN